VKQQKMEGKEVLTLKAADEEQPSKKVQQYLLGNLHEDAIGCICEMPLRFQLGFSWHAKRLMCLHPPA
jgi:hypothetical protein